jgi:hypothetical protein
MPTSGPSKPGCYFIHLVRFSSHNGRDKGGLICSPFSHQYTFPINRVYPDLISSSTADCQHLLADVASGQASVLQPADQISTWQSLTLHNLRIPWRRGSLRQLYTSSSPTRYTRSTSATVRFRTTQRSIPHRHWSTNIVTPTAFRRVITATEDLARVQKSTEKAVQ